MCWFQIWSQKFSTSSTSKVMSILSFKKVNFKGRYLNGKWSEKYGSTIRRYTVEKNLIKKQDFSRGNIKIVKFQIWTQKSSRVFLSWLMNILIFVRNNIIWNGAIYWENGVKIIYKGRLVHIQKDSVALFDFPNFQIC